MNPSLPHFTDVMGPAARKARALAASRQAAEDALADFEKRALWWDAILSCRDSDGSVFADSDAAGDPIPGTHVVVAFPSPADPMWRPEGTEPGPCPECDGSGWVGGGGFTFPQDGPPPVECPRCELEGVVELPRRFVYVGELDPSHRRNLYSWIMRRAPGLLGYEIASWSRMPGAGHDDMMRAASQAEEQLCADPWKWLAARPFMMALGALLIGDGNAPTVAAWERRAARADPERTHAAVLGTIIRGHVADLDRSDPTWRLRAEAHRAAAG